VVSPFWCIDQRPERRQSHDERAGVVLAHVGDDPVAFESRKEIEGSLADDGHAVDTATSAPRNHEDFRPSSTLRHLMLPQPVFRAAHRIGGRWEPGAEIQRSVRAKAHFIQSALDRQRWRVT